MTSVESWSLDTFGFHFATYWILWTIAVVHPWAMLAGPGTAVQPVGPAVCVTLPRPFRSHITGFRVLVSTLGFSTEFTTCKYLNPDTMLDGRLGPDDCIRSGT